MHRYHLITYVHIVTMLKAILFAALYGIPNGYSPAPQQQMCCTANVAMSHSYSMCEDVMNKFADAADQKNECLNGDHTGKINEEYTCKWTPCNDVGYCVDSRDNEYFDEIVNARRVLIEADYGQRDGYDGGNDYSNGDDKGYGNGNGNSYGNGGGYTPKPTSKPDGEGWGTPKPTVWKAPPTPKPTNPPKYAVSRCTQS